MAGALAQSMCLPVSKSFSVAQSPVGQTLKCTYPSNRASLLPFSAFHCQTRGAWGHSENIVSLRMKSLRTSSDCLVGTRLASLTPTTYCGAGINMLHNNGNSGEASNNGSGDEFVEATVSDAVRLVPQDNALVMKMADGKFVKLLHTNPAAGRLLYYNSVPTIFLRMEDDSDLMLPIVVGEVQSQMLVRALRKEAGGRPTVYEVIKEMVEKLKVEVRCVKLTSRVVDTYHACIDLGKPGDAHVVSIDARPSDAINLAVRCGVKIYVNKTVVAADGMRPTYTLDPDSTGALSPLSSRGVLISKLDTPLDGADPIAEEIVLMTSMSMAAVEERYADAARYRDELNQLRQKLRKRQSVPPPHLP